MIRTVLSISNHSRLMGGGEHSFLDFLTNLPAQWKPIAAVPEDTELSRILYSREITTHIVPLPPLRAWFLHAGIYSISALLRLCRVYEPSIIYANGSRAAFYGGIAGWVMRIPMIWHCRITSPDPYLDIILPRLSSRIIANSMATGKRFKKGHQKTVKVIYNGIDLNWLRDGTPEKPLMVHPDWRVILIVARVSKSKRHDLALNAFERLAKLDPSLHVVCVGGEDTLDSEWWKHLQQKSKRSLFSNRIHWIGQIADVRPWYRCATLLLLPSEMESFGRVLVEAMACGLPVVATKSGGIPEVVRDGIDGLLVTPRNEDELAKAALRILNDEVLRTRLSETAKKKAESFSLDIHIQKMVELFEQTARHWMPRLI